MAPYDLLLMFRAISLALVSLAAFLPAPGVQTRALTVRDIDGRAWTPLAPAAGDMHLLLFVTVDCPISNRYAPEIGRIATDNGSKGVRTFLIYADPSLDASRVRENVRAFRAGVALPAIIDSGFALSAAVDATVTPEAAIYTARGRAYRGRIDDLYVNIGQSRREATRKDLRLSLDALLAGRPAPNADTQAIGCFIERKRG